MPTKHPQRTYPHNLSAEDFKCYGPPASQDTEFENTNIADFGCFNQDSGVDSNKYYHACVCSDGEGRWYLYIEYGREGAGRPSFQFTEYASQSEAQKAYVKQCAEKNTKRGQWDVVAGLRRYVPKIKKNGVPEDLYVLRDMATRSVGLPDGKTIASVNHQKPKSKKSKKKPTYRCDPQTTKLFQDLIGGAVAYTRTSIQGGAIPTQRAIDDGRTLLQNALQRVGAIGDDLESQIQDTELRAITKLLYSSIPKIKPLGSPEQDWILSQNNILAWQQDLDTYETALTSDESETQIEGADPLFGMPLDMAWIDLKSDLGQWLSKWWMSATNHRNGYGTLKLLNLWKIQRHGDDEKQLRRYQDDVMQDMGDNWDGDRPLFQDKSRYDLSEEDRLRWVRSNSALVFHGSRSVNVPGILRENLRLPAQLVGVTINGAMFGAGSYYADDWQKSAGYTSLKSSYWSAGSGAVKGRQAFMFACDAVMGNPHLAPHPKGYAGYPSGTHCIFGKAGKTTSWGGTLLNNEWITFDRKPVLRYLAEFTC